MRKLDSADAVERRQAILVLSELLDDPRVVDMLRQKAEDDPDPQVRELARHTLQTAPLPAAFAATQAQLKTPPRPSKTAKTAPGPVWTCRFCDTAGISGDTCPNCGAGRAMGQPSTPPADVSARPTPGSVFVYFPKNQAFVEGRAKRPGMTDYGCWLVPLWLAFCSLVLIFVGVVLPSWNEARKLDRAGVLTEAKVYDRRISEGDDSSSYYISYRFTVRGTDGEYRDYQREQQVSSGHYYAWGPGQTVRVRYLPDNPTRSELVDDGTENTSRWIGMILNVAAAAGVLIILVLVWEHRNSRRLLLREGRLIPGRVVSCSSREDSDNDLWVTLQYSFISPLTGKRIEKQIDRIANYFKGVQLPHPGDAVMVFYRNDQHFMLM